MVLAVHLSLFEERFAHATITTEYHDDDTTRNLLFFMDIINATDDRHNPNVNPRNSTNRKLSVVSVLV